MYVHTCTHLTLTLNTQSDAVTHKPWISWPRGQKKGEEEERDRERDTEISDTGKLSCYSKSLPLGLGRKVENW